MEPPRAANDSRNNQHSIIDTSHEHVQPRINRTTLLSPFVTFHSPSNSNHHLSNENMNSMLLEYLLEKGYGAEHPRIVRQKQS